MPHDTVKTAKVELSGFDKTCGVLAIVFGFASIVLGALGLFLGCNASLTLPPVLGFLPALIGWGIVRAVVVAWRASNVSDLAMSGN